MATPSSKSTRDRKQHIGLIVIALLAAGCEKRHKPGSTTTSAATKPAEKTASSPDAKRPPFAAGAPPLLEPVLKFLPADGLRGPASVIHDEASDVYLSSNVDGGPVDADGRAFISKLAPDGRKVLARWIEGGKNKVVLNAPRGMALRGDELYVADIDTVRIFDRRTGAPMDAVKIPGTKFLSDVTVAPDGSILVSDGGLSANAGGNDLEVSGTGTVYAIYRDRHVTNINFVAKETLASPTALFATPDRIWSVSSRTGELFWIDAHGKLNDIQKLPEGALEGIVAVGDELLVSSRAASAILRGRLNGKWRIAIGDVRSPADIGYDRTRRRVLVPLFTEDEVRIYDLE
ncbi:MAG TPA: hypothetical protein VM925_05415 [Labilithrix sp.]|nr:hypothetical protein [Labilithrix sp.]